MPRPQAPRPRAAFAAPAVFAGLAVSGFAVLAAVPAASAQNYVPGYGTPLGGGVSPGPSQVVTTRDDSWAEALFEKSKAGTLARDFGVVARGAETTDRVVVTNTLDVPVHVADVRTSCGCSSGEWLGDKTLQPGEEGVLKIGMDTKRYSGAKDSNVIVTLDAPRFAEVRIPVKMYARTDVVLTPGSVDFGRVEKGAGATRTVKIAYAGFAGWTVKEVQTANGSRLKTELKETGRTAGTANYDLTVTLPADTPVGPFRQRLRLVTADVKNPFVPVLVEGAVEDDIAVADVQLGSVRAGGTQMFNVVLRGKKPFKIVGMECDAPDGRFKMKLPDAERTVHVVRMAFEPPADAEPGVVAETFTVTVDGRDDPVTFKAKGRVI